MIDLTNCKFGDKFETRNGRMAVIIKSHPNPRKPWFTGIIGDPNCDLSNSWAYEAHYYSDGTAQEDFTHLDLIKKL